MGRGKREQAKSLPGQKMRGMTRRKKVVKHEAPVEAPVAINSIKDLKLDISAEDHKKVDDLLAQLSPEMKKTFDSLPIERQAEVYYSASSSDENEKIDNVGLDKAINTIAQEHHNDKASELLRSNQVKIADSQEAEEKIVNAAASQAHEDWRASRKLEDGTFEPRIKKTSDAEWMKRNGIAPDENGQADVDIANSDYAGLPKDWQKDNYQAAQSAESAVREQLAFQQAREQEAPIDINQAAARVHDFLVERHGDEEWTAEAGLLVPYAELSEEEKEKDRVVVRGYMENAGLEITEHSNSYGKEEAEVARELRLEEIVNVGHSRVARAKEKLIERPTGKVSGSDDLSALGQTGADALRMPGTVTDEQKLAREKYWNNISQHMDYLMEGGDVRYYDTEIARDEEGDVKSYQFERYSAGMTEEEKETLRNDKGLKRFLKKQHKEQEKADQIERENKAAQKMYENRKTVAAQIGVDPDGPMDKYEDYNFRIRTTPSHALSSSEQKDYQNYQNRKPKDKLSESELDVFGSTGPPALNATDRIRDLIKSSYDSKTDPRSLRNNLPVELRKTWDVQMKNFIDNGCSFE